MKERIRQLMEDLGLTQQDFAKTIGKSTATVSGIFNDRTKPSLDIVDAIHKKFPRVRLEWLLDGTPPMYMNKVEGDADGASTGEVQGSTALGGKQGEMGGMGANAIASALGEATLDFGTDEAPGSPTSPSIFDQTQMHGVNRIPKNVAQAAVKYIDKPQRKITEIRIFYDDQTWETFVPKK